MADTLRVLIADDAAFFRRVTKNALAEIEGVEVVAAVSDGREAVERVARGDVQLAILDIEMPQLDGLAASREIAQRFPSVQVAILSGTATSARTMEALASDAIDVVHKPNGATASDMLRASLERVVNAARAVRAAQERRRLRTERPAAAPLAPATPLAPTRAPAATTAPAAAAPEARSVARVRPRLRKYDLVLIGVSTGGPKALMELVPRLPANLPAPVLIVQHMSAGFTASLADSLARQSKLAVKEAADGDVAEAGRVLIAPGGLHMELERGAPPRVRFTSSPPVNGCRPAVDVLWNSVAANYRGEVLGVVLTGMGKDGRDGMKALRMRGAYCVAQDEATSIVWGMPGAVVEAGIADEIVPLGDIASRIESLVQQSGKG